MQPQPLLEQSSGNASSLESLLTFPGGAVKLSTVIVTHNASKNIRRTLSQLDWCDEIIVVDSFSTDDTVAICRAFNCRVYLKKFEGHRAQRQYAVSRASHDWILSIDADEVLSDVLFMEIALALRENPGYVGYRLASGLVFFDKEFLYGKESWHYSLRLFNKNYGHFTDGPDQARVKLEGRVCKLRHKMLHYSCRDLFQWEEKYGRYPPLAAWNAVTRERDERLVLVLLSLPFYFLKHYLLELNFLNGVPGFYWSALNTWHRVIKHKKNHTATCTTEKQTILKKSILH
jgi:glycosyltransferase involved in cell wall biosynthesis